MRMLSVADDFRFDPDEHRYWLGKRELPSVTTILDTSFPIDYSDDYAMKRGSAVHLACQLHDENDLDEASLDLELRGYLAGWRKFLQESGFVADQDGIEAARCHLTLGYAGMLDRIGSCGLKRLVIDIKTGGERLRYRLQLAAYANLLDDPMRYHRLAVFLQPDGTYQTKEYPRLEFATDLAIFQSELNIFNFKRRYAA